MTNAQKATYAAASMESEWYTPDQYPPGVAQGATERQPHTKQAVKEARALPNYGGWLGSIYDDAAPRKVR